MAMAMQGWRREASRTLHRQCHDSIKIISHIEFYHSFSKLREAPLAFNLTGSLRSDNMGSTLIVAALIFNASTASTFFGATQQIAGVRGHT